MKRKFLEVKRKQGGVEEGASELNLLISATQTNLSRYTAKIPIFESP